MSTDLSEVARTAAKAADYTVRRDRAIVAARAAGLSLRAIGDAAGLSHTAIAIIVKRQESRKDA